MRDKPRSFSISLNFYQTILEKTPKKKKSLQLYKVLSDNYMENKMFASKNDQSKWPARGEFDQSSPAVIFSPAINASDDFKMKYSHLELTSCYGTYTVVGVNIKREMVLLPNDKEVANSSKNIPNSRLECTNHPLFQTKMAKKTSPLARHIPI